MSLPPAQVGRGPGSHRVDCRGRLAKDVLGEVLPHCLEARSLGHAPVLQIENLAGLSDSVTRLLKAFDRLAEDFGARIKIADSSGFGEAFLRALAGTGHFQLMGGCQNDTKR